MQDMNHCTAKNVPKKKIKIKKRDGPISNRRVGLNLFYKKKFSNLFFDKNAVFWLTNRFFAWNGLQTWIPLEKSNSYCSFPEQEFDFYFDVKKKVSPSCLTYQELPLSVPCTRLATMAENNLLCSCSSRGSRLIKGQHEAFRTSFCGMNVYKSLCQTELSFTSPLTESSCSESWLAGL